MPNYKGHLFGGMMFGGALIGIVGIGDASWLTMLEWFGFLMLGSLFPDIDTKSKGQKIFYTTLIVLMSYCLMQGYQALFIALSFLGLVPLLVHHRGLFHHPWFIVCFSAVPPLLAQLYVPQYFTAIAWDSLFFGIGAFSHLILDFGIKRFLRRLFS